MRLPTRLTGGPHEIRVRLADSGFGETATIYCGDRPQPVRSPIPEDITPELYRVSNGLSESREFHGHRSEYLCVCFHLAVPQLDREDIVVEIGGIDCAPSFLGSADGWGPGEGWQANVKLPSLLPGTVPVRVRTKVGQISNSIGQVVTAMSAVKPTFVAGVRRQDCRRATKSLPSHEIFRAPVNYKIGPCATRSSSR